MAKVKRREVGIFTWLAALDELYHAVTNVITKTVKHPGMPSALVRLRNSQQKLKRLQSTLEVVKKP